METTTIERTVGAGASLAQEVVQQIARIFESEANVKAVFGAPVQLDGHTVIPVATVFVSFGGGVGIGGGLGKAVAGAVALANRILPRAFAGGAGGGVNVSVRPVGFIHDAKEGVAFTPIVVQHAQRERMTTA
jgi:uncharacterized spore protein YtfJ